MSSPVFVWGDLEERDTTDSGFVATSTGLLVPGEAREIRACDLFAGCGGFSLGFQTAGINVVAALEWDPNAIWTYLTNLGSRAGCAVGYVDETDRLRLAKALRKAEDGWIGSNNRDRRGGGCRAMMVGDASKVTGDSMRSLLRASGTSDRIDVVMGGPPCQGFSTSGRQDPADPRNNLVLEFWRLADELGADSVLMENVPPLMTDPKFRPLWNAAVKRANDAGYDVVANILDAANYGVPQYRRRVFMVGSRGRAKDRPFQFPIPETWGFGSWADGRKWDMDRHGARTKGETEKVRTKRQLELLT